MEMKPELSHCVICGKEKGIFDYSIKLGGVICSDHFNVVESRLTSKAKRNCNFENNWSFAYRTLRNN